MSSLTFVKSSVKHRPLPLQENCFLETSKLHSCFTRRWARGWWSFPHNKWHPCCQKVSPLSTSWHTPIVSAYTTSPQPRVLDSTSQAQGRILTVLHSILMWMIFSFATFQLRPLVSTIFPLILESMTKAQTALFNFRALTEETAGFLATGSLLGVSGTGRNSSS